MDQDQSDRIALRARTMRTRREAVDHRWRVRQAQNDRAPLRPAHEPEQGWLDGPAGVLRAAAILLAAALLGVGYAAIVDTTTQTTAAGPQA